MQRPSLVCSHSALSHLITNLASLLQRCSVLDMEVESSWAVFPACQGPWCRGCLEPGYPECLSWVSSECRGSGDLCRPPVTQPPPASTSQTRVTRRPLYSSSWPPGPRLLSKLLQLPQLGVSLSQGRRDSCQVKQLLTCWPIPYWGQQVGAEV